MNRFSKSKFSNNKILYSIVIIVILVFTMIIVHSFSNKKDINISGSCTIEPVAVRIAKLYNDVYHKSAYIIAGGSQSGINQVINGGSDIGLVSRSLTHSEKTDLSYETIGYDSIAIITNSQNPIKNITTEQLSEIYAGKVDNWKSLTNFSTPVMITSQKTGSAAYEVFNEHIKIFNPDDPKGIKDKHGIRMTYRANIFKNELDCNYYISENKGAIGFMSLGTAQNLIHQGFKIKLLKLDGIEPTVNNVTSGKYPIKRELNLVFKPENKKVQDYIGFALKPESQKLVKEMNFIPVKK